jgi:AcrR family transcriptional regulator
MSVAHSGNENRAERRRRHTREQLKRAASDLMTERGYSAITVQAITDYADLGHGTFYLYFKDKDDLVAELLENIADARMTELEKSLAGEPPLRRAYLAWHDFFQHALNNREAYLACFKYHGSAYLQQRIMNYTAVIHVENTQRQIYITNGRNVPIQFMAQFVTGALWRLLLWWLENPESFTPEEMARNVFEMVYHQSPE